ncbi:MAG: hypothetical protein LN412_03170 [Candidatus Thermoplasmatota archaeon]|nr:hypothetical protein [Candidatus Thermoplasmatota archaeon]
MPKNRRFLKIVTASIWAGSIATIALSFYTARATGYEYAPLTSFRTYNGILTGSAFALAIIMISGILTMHRVDASSQRLVKSMREALEPNYLPVNVSQIQVAANEEFEQRPNSSKAQWLHQTLKEYHDLQIFRRDIKSLLAAPVGLLSAIFAISAWALPATEVFLQGSVYLNTTLLFFVTYGMVLAIASVIIAVLVMLSSGETAA